MYARVRVCMYVPTKVYICDLRAYVGVNMSVCMYDFVCICFSLDSSSLFLAPAV